MKGTCRFCEARLTREDVVVHLLHGNADEGSSSGDTLEFHLAERVRLADEVHYYPHALLLVSESVAHDLVGRAARLLSYLIRNVGQVVTRGQIIDGAWNGEVMDEREVDVYIKRIRSLLPFPVRYTLIRTIRGIGYRLVPI